MNFATCANAQASRPGEFQRCPDQQTPSSDVRSEVLRHDGFICALIVAGRNESVDVGRYSPNPATGGAQRESLTSDPRSFTGAV